jgi:hypothetical protein
MDVHPNISNIATKHGYITGANERAPSQLEPTQIITRKSRSPISHLIKEDIKRLSVDARKKLRMSSQLYNKPTINKTQSLMTDGKQDISKSF